MEREIEFTYADHGERLDQYLARRLEGVSRAVIQKWVASELVTVNGRSAKPSDRLEVGDRICVVQPEPKPVTVDPVEMPLSIVYEDADCVVVDKSAGLVVHPATSHQQDTLVNGLLARYPDMASMVDAKTEEGRRPGIVHRLDRDTSGLIVVARHEAAKGVLQRQFRARQVEKRYVALLHGRLSEPSGSIHAPIARDPRHRQRMAVVVGGREAMTDYATQSYLFLPQGSRERFTLVEARPVTGRTHQIRVHFAHVGHPVVSDATYGQRKSRLACPRQFLHACRLAFRRPSDGEWVDLESPLPDDLQRVLSQLAAVV